MSSVLFDLCKMSASTLVASYKGMIGSVIPKPEVILVDEKDFLDYLFHPGVIHSAMVRSLPNATAKSTSFEKPLPKKKGIVLRMRKVQKEEVVPDKVDILDPSSDGLKFTDYGLEDGYWDGVW